MAKQRDMTKAQFAAAVQRYGMKFEGFMGYVDLGLPGRRLAVSHWNAGDNRRAKLAYLLQCRDCELEKMDAEAKKKA